MPRPQFEVADIVRNLGASLREGLARDQHRVVSAITACRTAVLGGHTSRCADCAHIDVAYNSCRNRHCPKCQAAAYDWLEARKADLLPVAYYHVVFTLPAPIADIALSNKAAVYDALFKATAETLLTIGGDPSHLGARLGATLVLHTWGSAMTHHPHIHGIVPGGGFSKDGSAWIDCRKDFFLPYSATNRMRARSWRCSATRPISRLRCTRAQPSARAWQTLRWKDCMVNKWTHRLTAVGPKRQKNI